MNFLTNRRMKPAYDKSTAATAAIWVSRPLAVVDGELRLPIDLKTVRMVAGDEPADLRADHVEANMFVIWSVLLVGFSV